MAQPLIALSATRSSQECLGFHLGAPQTANLGDGNGSKNQSVELRQDFGNDILGSCLESLLGGNHFRYVVSDCSRSDVDR